MVTHEGMGVQPRAPTGGLTALARLLAHQHVDLASIDEDDPLRPIMGGCLQRDSKPRTGRNDRVPSRM